MNREERLKMLTQLTEEVVNKITELGELFGFKTKTKWRTEGAELDIVWYVDVKSKSSLFKEFDNKCPVAVFEIETSGRTEKHLKGDVVNMMLLPTYLSVIILLKKGYDPENTTITYLQNKETVKQLSQKLTGGKLLIWDIDDINKYLHDIKKA